MRTVAVLPFADLSPHGDQGHFGDGLSEELAFALSRVPNVHLTSQTSAFAFKGERTNVREIGRQLGVKCIVEGNVRKAGQKLEIMVRPADVATAFQIWSELYTLYRNAGLPSNCLQPLFQPRLSCEGKVRINFSPGHICTIFRYAPELALRRNGLKLPQLERECEFPPSATGAVLTKEASKCA